MYHPPPEVRRDIGHPRWRWVFWAILTLGLLLRLVGIHSLPWEQDELYTLRDAVGWEFGDNLGRPLYYALQHVLLSFLPPTEFFLRLPALAFGILGIGATWLLGRTLLGPVAATASALLLAIAPWHLHASQFARYWTLVYLLSALSIYFLFVAIRSDRGHWYLAALTTGLLGMVTHPTFLFAWVGVLLAIRIRADEGRWRWAWGTYREWGYLLAPLLITITVAAAAILLAGREAALIREDTGGRGLIPSLRVFPAAIQWLDPTLVAAFLLGLVVLGRANVARFRQWSVVAVGGVLSMSVFLAVAAPITDVYVGYGMAALPLVFVTVGGLVQWIHHRVRSERWIAPAVLGLVIASVLPSTVSHAMDGTRFDYRPAHDFIREHQRKDANLTLVWPIAIHRAYASDLHLEELSGDARQLQRLLTDESAFWVISSHRRHGMLRSAGDAQGWLRMNCRVLFVHQGRRLDYRLYRVEVHRCDERYQATAEQTCQAALPPRRASSGGAVREETVDVFLEGERLREPLGYNI